MRPAPPSARARQSGFATESSLKATKYVPGERAMTAVPCCFAAPALVLSQRTSWGRITRPVAPPAATRV